MKKVWSEKACLEEVTPELSFKLGNGKMATIYLGCEARELGRVPEPL